MAALVGGRQIALFQVRRARLRARQLRPGEPRQRAVARPDRRPAGRARGRVAYLQASFLRSTSGRCIEDPTFNVTAYPTRVTDGRVFVEAPRRGCGARAWWWPATAWPACARSKNCSSSASPTASPSPCSAPSRAATTTASCCRRCSPASSRPTTSCCTGPTGTRAAASRCIRAIRSSRSTASGARCVRRTARVAQLRPAAHRHRLRSHRAAAAGQGSAGRGHVPRSR